MTILRKTIAVLAFTISLAMLLAPLAQAQDLGLRPLRYGNTSPWSYDNRDDHRDFPTNGFYPGNFTSDPSTSWLGIAGALAGNSERSAYPYPSQVVIGATPFHPNCLHARDYDRATGTYLGRDGLRHRC